MPSKQFKKRMFRKRGYQEEWHIPTVRLFFRVYKAWHG